MQNWWIPERPADDPVAELTWPPSVAALASTHRFPTVQSWATWEYAVKRLSLPIRVDSLFLRRAALSVTFSRITFRSPIGEPRRLAAILLILRSGAHRRELEHHVVRTDHGRALDHDVRTDARPRLDLDTFADHRVGINSTSSASTACGEIPRSRYRRRHRIQLDRRTAAHPGITMSSAPQASWPSTSATVANLQIVRIRRVRSP